ncbi:cytochrome P450 [Frankia sp. AgB1.9]|uniref:cytochrome P450 n=1 Tax=unclassified Frankia TaxID=2632575 RepID=UPI001932864C|nr:MULTISPECIES: cytochrome P450 [unclassified Frankia]MBL7488513.1 cytochrome P450 [Frankia sp. AgW1.1]MBL7547296.1 cytochrome P450 [Frankia sp. AgB1.9]MBL7620799.1 cytochrome P450 [Frankia sp. AgB1.8]
MTATQSLDRGRLKELFDLRSSYNAGMGGDFEADPYPVWERLRAQAPVHEGTVHKLTGYPGEAFFQGLPFPDRQHFSVFGFAACDAAFRDEETFASSPVAVDPTGQSAGVENSLISMNGAQHRRYRALVQPSFLPAKSGWWINNWIEETVHLLIDGFAADGRAELNVDFCAAIPILTITSSFGIPVEQALIIREWLSQPAKIVGMLAPIVAARRESPQDDLISVLVQAELPDENGVTHRLSDVEIYSFAILLLLAGSGTTWKQMGIVLTALLERPELLAAVRADRRLLRPAIEEAIRWTPTDPMFSRFVARDTDFYGTHLPKGSVLHLCVAAANRDPARWERPDEFDIHRPMQRSLGFGGGMHICLGMHVARAEMTVGIGAVLDRLPNLRLDPDASAPRVIGMYERGATEIPVLFG